MFVTEHLFHAFMFYSICNPEQRRHSLTAKLDTATCLRLVALYNSLTMFMMPFSWVINAIQGVQNKVKRLIEHNCQIFLWFQQKTLQLRL